MKTLGLILFSFTGVAFAQGAPFCVFSGAGANCIFYSVQECQSAARTLDGMCGPNTAAQQPQYTPRPAAPAPYVPPPVYSAPQTGIFDSFQRGYENGQRIQQAQEEARMQREAHEANMRLIEAKADAASKMTPPTTSEDPIIEGYSAKALARKCDSYIAAIKGQSTKVDDAVYMGYCVGFMHGFRGGYDAGTIKEAPKHCIRSEADTETLVRALIAAVDTSPALHDHPQDVVLALVLARAYPCK